MLRVLFIGLLLYIGYRIIVALFSPKTEPEKTGRKTDSGEETHQDPVCGVYVSEDTAVIGRHNGRRHYFCSMNCLEKYRERLDDSSQS